MKYKKEKSKRIDKALSLKKDQVQRLNNAIQKAYDSVYNNSLEDFSIDEINSLVAPYIKTGIQTLFHRILSFDHY